MKLSIQEIRQVVGRLLFGVFCLITSVAHADPTPSGSPSGPASPAKMTNAQLREEFDKVEASRATIAANTKERADAAQRAMQLASDLAWVDFEAGKYGDAANWFARSAALKKEKTDNSRGYWEGFLQGEAVESEKKLGARVSQLQGELTGAQDEEKKKSAQNMINMLEGMRHTLRYNAVSMLEGIARESNDSTSMVKYAEEELSIRRTELQYLESSGAPAKDRDLKKLEVAKALEGIAGAQADLTLFGEAEKNFNEALTIRRSVPETMAERRVDETLSAMGHMYLHKVGDLAKARQFYSDALADIQASAELRAKALAEDSLSADVKATMTAEERASHEQMVAQNRDMTVALGTMAQCIILSNLGDVAEESGNLTEAGSFYDRSLKLVEALPKGGYLNIFELARAQIRARTFGDLAYLHTEGGQVDLALKELDEAIKIKRELGQDENSANSLQQSAGLLYDKGDLEKARRYVEQARQIFAGAHRVQGVVSCTSFLAVIARDGGQLDEAARWAQEALELAGKTGNSGSVSGTARTFASIRLKQGRVPEARTLVEQAMAADGRTNSRIDKMATLGLLGEVLEAEGANDKALESYREAVTLLESVRATAASEASFADVKRNARPYERIVKLLIKMERADEAFDYLSRAKSQKLRESMPLSSVKSQDKATQQTLDKVGTLEAKLQAATGQLQGEQSKPEGERDPSKLQNLKLVAASTQEEFFRVADEIKANNPNWEKLVTVKPRELRKAQKSIPEGVTFLQYAPLGEQLYIFVVTKSSLKIYTPPVKPEDLWKQVKAVRRQITSGEAGGGLTKNLTGLYDMLIAPIESELASTKTIAFIPNQLLFYLPIQALAKKQPNGELRYLIEDKEIVYLPGADVMTVIGKEDTGKSREGMTAFANPTGAELPSAEVEARTIAQIFPGTEVLAGAQATKGSMNEQRLSKRVVHFATHGRLNSTTPRSSYIQLASGGAPGQEQLTVGEVYGLALEKVDLVTLSACETALGDKDPDGGELTTLADAFSMAGATSVVASLWSVGDESTKEFMVEFYKQLSVSGTSKVSALRSAQLSLMKNPKYSRPLYWAPFVLMGDWR